MIELLLLILIILIAIWLIGFIFTNLGAAIIIVVSILAVCVIFQILKYIFTSSESEKNINSKPKEYIEEEIVKEEKETLRLVGFDVNIEAFNGDTPMKIAKSKGNKKMMEILKEQQRKKPKENGIL
ncbi:MAG: hypothetical protein ACPG8V_04145 [Alphaproteobacteria bacterium]